MTHKSPNHRRQIGDLPGPRQWPLLGNALQVKRKTFHQSLEKWALTYGPMYKLRLGRQQMLVISDHEMISDVLRQRPNGFRRPSNMARVIQEMGVRRGLFIAEGPQWLRQRRMVMSAFSPAQVRAYFPALLTVCSRLATRWTSAAQSTSTIDLQADLMRFTVDAIAGLAFGVETNTLERDDDIIQHHLDKVSPAISRRLNSWVPYWRYIRMPVDRELDRSLDYVHGAIKGYIAQARERMKDDASRRTQPRNLIESFIAAANEQDSGFNDDVAGNMFTMLMAGEDTTANSLAWLIYLLAGHPTALSEATTEVRRVVSQWDALTFEDMDRLPYVEACIHEAMRLKPVTPFQILEALHDTEIADIHVPKGTVVWAPVRVEATAEHHVRDGQTYCPDRWLAEGAAHAKRMSIPFGAGPRICPGRYLSLVEMKLVMAMLLSRFDVLGVDTPNGGPAQELMAFTMAPVGLRLRLQQRRQNIDALSMMATNVRD